MEDADLELFAQGIEHATATSSGKSLDEALSELGWPDALVDDRRAAVSLLFESQGAANASSSALDHVLASALAPAGARSAGVVLPPLRERTAPGRRRAARVMVRGLSTGGLARHETAWVVAPRGETDAGHTAFAVPTSALEFRLVGGIDPELGIVEVSGDLAPPDAEEIPVDWVGAVALGQLALAHELVGAARTMLELARQHALDRIQFDRPIGSFQAVRHRLAESLVAIEAAGALLDATWEDPSPVNAAMAKSVAGRAAQVTARRGQQVLAGIGFTTEHPLHRYLRRTIVLDQLLGAGSALTRQLGSDVLTRGALPPAFPL
jgi:hypothetical protein